MIDFVQKSIDLANQNHIDASLDIIYEKMDKLCYSCRDNSNWEPIDEIMSITQVEKCSTYILVALLITSSWCKSHLKNRNDFYIRCEQEIRKRGEWNSKILENLGP